MTMMLSVEAVVKNVDVVTDFVDERLEQMGCSMRAQTQIDIAIDELFSNICHYAYADKVGTATVHVEPLPDGENVAITLEDGGVAFNPLKRADPDVSLGIHERGIGGLGIFLVKKSMDQVKYRYENGLNKITIIKRLREKPTPRA